MIARYYAELVSAPHALCIRNKSGNAHFISGRWLCKWDAEIISA
jgi:hypothetical protein